MFLLAPLSVFVISSVAVLYICFRKFSYLKKLNADHNGEVVVASPMTLSQFLHEMFPEVFDYFKRIDVAAHKSSFLLEFEKFLRKTRLAFLKIDNLSNSLIHKVRATHLQEAQKSQDKIEARKIEGASVSEVVTMSDEAAIIKKKEHELIIEIAKNPKNPLLYKHLGDLYIDTKQWNYAKESFSSALKLDPNIRGVKRKLEVADKMTTQGH